MQKENKGSNKLLETISPTTLKLLEWLSDRAGKQQVSIYIVGGFVRDLILHHPTTDFDIVIEGDAIKFAKSLSRELGGMTVIHSAFGTAVWNIHSIHEKLRTELSLNESRNFVDLPKHVDFISSREETYPYPAALPVVKPGSIESDLLRRDFSINTLAIKLNKNHFGELMDLFDGYKDIQNGRIRILHDKSFRDDPTRQLRAVRFEKRFGFQIDAHTLDLMQNARSYLGIITGIRVRHEMDLMLKEDHFETMFLRAQELEILAAIHASLRWKESLVEAFHKISQFNWDSDWGVRPSFGRMGFKTGLKYSMWLALLPIQDQEALVRRLSIPQAISTVAGKAYALREILPGLKGKSISEITFQLDRFPAIVNFGCFLLANDEWTRKTIEQYLINWRKILPVTNGHDLRNLGLMAGSAYKIILQTLRAAWLDGQIHSRNEEQVLLKDLLKQKGDFFTK